MQTNDGPLQSNACVRCDLLDWTKIDAPRATRFGLIRVAWIDWLLLEELLTDFGARLMIDSWVLLMLLWLSFRPNATVQWSSDRDPSFVELQEWDLQTASVVAEEVAVVEEGEAAGSFSGTAQWMEVEAVVAEVDVFAAVATCP